MQNKIRFSQRKVLLTFLVATASLTFWFGISQAPALAQTTNETGTKTHVLKFYLDPALVSDMNFAKQVLPKYVSDMNFILAKNTNRRLLFDPETGIILTTTKPQTDYATGTLPVANYEVWAHAVLSNQPYSYGGYSGFDKSGAAALGGLKWLTIYDPDTLSAGTTAMRDYWIQIDHMLHEYAHVYGAGNGEYYNVATVIDTTGVAPLLNINLNDPADSYWQARPDYLVDPLLRMVYGVAQVGNPTSREALLSTVRFAPLTAAIMSGDYRSPGTLPPTVDLQNMKIVVKNAATGETLPGVQVKIWNTRSAYPDYSELLVEGTTDALGEFPFAWGGSADPHNNYENVHLVKVYQAGYQDLAEYFSIYDTDEARLLRGEPTFSLTVEMSAVSSTPPDTTPPITAISDPGNGATLSGTVPIAATASDDASGIARVEFYVDGGLLASATSTPYSVNWNTTATTDGTHTLLAKAYDAAGNVGSSTPVTVTVDNNAPIVSLTNPLNNSDVSTGLVPLVASASDNVGVTKVEFYADGVLLSSDLLSPYSATWNTTALSHNSSHTLYAKAYDSIGNAATSSVITVRIIDTILPAVTITQPVNGSTVLRNSTVSIIAAASDVSGIAKVEFYVNNTLKCTDTAASYSCSWKVPSKSRTTYTIQAKAFDVAGNNSTHTIQVTSR